MELVELIPHCRVASALGLDDAVLLRNLELLLDLGLDLLTNQFDAFANRLLRENLERSRVDLSVELLQLKVVWHLVTDPLGQSRAVELEGLAHGTLALLLADVGPG